MSRRAKQSSSVEPWPPPPVPEPEPEPAGVQCPRCGCRHVPVLYVRDAPRKRKRRRRECRHCGARFTTLEGAA